MSASSTPHTIPWKRCLVVIVIAASTIWMSLMNQAPTTATESGVIMDLPDQVGDFPGKALPVSKNELNLLPTDTEFAKKTYRTPSGQEITCQVVLSGAEKRSIHRPEVCLPGQGWTIKSTEFIPVPLKSGQTLTVAKLTLTQEFELKSGERKLVTMFYLYWFVGKNKTTAKHTVRILLTSWDRIMHNVNHRWAYVIVSAPVTDNLMLGGLDRDQTMKMLKDFIAEVTPSIIKPGVEIH